VSQATPLPRIGAPATRALTAAGYHCLEDLDGASRSILLALHGVGPRTVQILEEALSAGSLTLVE
jgi:hypothetical protein